MIQARVLRELPDGSVGVYYKMIVDSKSFMPDSIVQSSLWNTVQDFWKMAPRCADAKKLCYCVEHSDVLNLSARYSPCDPADPFTCGICGTMLLKCRRRSLGEIATAVVHGALPSTSTQAFRCTLCSSWLCSKSHCCAVRQLVRIDRATLDVDRQIVVLCTNCTDIVRRKNATEIARRGLQELHRAFKDSDPPYAGSCGKRQTSQPKNI